MSRWRQKTFITNKTCLVGWCWLMVSQAHQWKWPEPKEVSALMTTLLIFIKMRYKVRNATHKTCPCLFPNLFSIFWRFLGMICLCFVRFQWMKVHCRAERRQLGCGCFSLMDSFHSITIANVLAFKALAFTPSNFHLQTTHCVNINWFRKGEKNCFVC